MKTGRTFKCLKATAIRFGMGLSQHFEEDATVCCFLLCVRTVTKRLIVILIQGLKLEVLPSHFHSPVLASREFHRLGLYKTMSAQDEGVKQAVLTG